MRVLQQGACELVRQYKRMATRTIISTLIASLTCFLNGGMPGPVDASASAQVAQNAVILDAADSFASKSLCSGSNSEDMCFLHGCQPAAAQHAAHNGLSARELWYQSVGTSLQAMQRRTSLAEAWADRWSGQSRVEQPSLRTDSGLPRASRELPTYVPTR